MGGLAQNVQKTPPGKNVPKSQGQIFQECQGQIPRSNISGMCGMCGMSGMPRSNFPRSNRKKPVLTGKMGKCNKNKKTINT